MLLSIFIKLSEYERRCVRKEIKTETCSNIIFYCSHKVEGNNQQSFTMIQSGKNPSLYTWHHLHSIMIFNQIELYESSFSYSSSYFQKFVALVIAPNWIHWLRVLSFFFIMDLKRVFRYYKIDNCSRHPSPSHNALSDKIFFSKQ